MHPRTLPPLAAALLFLTALAARAGGPPWSTSRDWPPVDPADLGITEGVPPDAHAVILYREQHNDDFNFVESHYLRIKILTSQGKEQANIEVPYFKFVNSIDDLHARVIRPDGTIVTFQGEVFDKTLVSRGRSNFMAKTLSLPDVDVGSIIEYRFRRPWKSAYLRSTTWLIESELPTKRARFSIQPEISVNLFWTMLGFKTDLTRHKDGSFVLELDDIAAFVTEPFMPPAAVVRRVVYLYYQAESKLDEPDEFWRKTGQALFKQVESYIGKPGKVAAESARIVAGIDDPEKRLRAIYDRVQKVRNLSWQSEQEAEDEEREKLEERDDVAEVLERGYGNAFEIGRLFVALTRAAGFDAGIVRVCRRDLAYFRPSLRSAQLGSEVVIVRLGERDVYLDPGTAGCPFATLWWPKSGVRGLRLAKDGGTFVTTPGDQNPETVIQHVATFDLALDGTISGTVRVERSGQSAIAWRHKARDLDDEGRKKQLEERLKELLPTDSIATLSRTTGWDQSEEPIAAEFDVTLRGAATVTGTRVLVPVSLIQERDNTWDQPQRRFPIDLHYPYASRTEITLRLPVGLAIESLPTVPDLNPAFARFSIATEPNESSIVMRRKLAITEPLLPAARWPDLRDFFMTARDASRETMVLRAAAPNAKEGAP